MDGWLVFCFQGKSDAPPSDVATAAIILMLASDIFIKQMWLK